MALVGKTGQHLTLAVQQDPTTERGGSHTGDRPGLGIVLVLGAGLSFSMADATSKVLSSTIPLVEITWLRWIGLVVAVLPTLIASGGTVLRSAAPRLQIFRSLGLVGSSFFFICGVSQLSLPSAISISFVSPLFVTALSIPLLGEEVGIRRWAALVVGLAGVLVVIRPGSDTFEPAALFPLVSSSCWAAAVVTTRKLGTADPPMTALTYTALIGFALLSVFVPVDFVMPAGRELWVAGGMAIFSLSGQFLTLLAYRYAPASLLVPFSYMQLIWSTAFGYLIFRNLPDFWTWLGAGIVITSGIYTAHRERVRHKEALVRDHLIKPFKG